MNDEELLELEVYLRSIQNPGNSAPLNDLAQKRLVQILRLVEAYRILQLEIAERAMDEWGDALDRDLD